MPRAVWSGTISFGLVTIPVRLYPATSPKDVRFHLVDERGARVHFRRYVEADDVEPIVAGDDGGSDEPQAFVGAGSPRLGREVAFDELQRGYETDDGMVVVSPQEIEAVRPSPSREIAIEDFVDLADIDPVYYEKSYILAPRDEAAKPYALLLRAMERSGRAGIGRFVLRTKPHLVVIRPAGDVLSLETMFFADEVRDGRSLVPNLDSVEIAEKEVTLAQTLIDTLKTRWDPSHYEDTYRQELLDRLSTKRPVTAPAVAGPQSGQIDELLDALKRSVEEAKKSRSRASKRSA
ncbi:MAG TPA: Ku protein [Actinomycetota bacterium]|jgi:DNA end-binding protein Ku|nr:Ku protein [Actinomycetota bacterium]